MQVRFSATILAAFLVFTFSLHAMAATTIGGSMKKDFSRDALLYGVFLRAGGLIKLEFGGYRPYSSSSNDIKLLSYLLFDMNLGSAGTENGSLHLYLGASPNMTLNTSSPSFSVSSSSAYAKTGLQLNIFPFSVRLQSSGKFNLSGDLMKVFGGLGLGLTF